MHSALKKDGKALYEYARAGDRSRARARAMSRSIRCAGAMVDARPRCKIVAKVSKGTYIRTLGEDIGEALGCGAHLTSLRRMATGPFELRNASRLRHSRRMDEPERLARLLPVEALLAGHTPVTLGTEDAAASCQRPAPARRLARRSSKSPSYGHRNRARSSAPPTQGRRTDPGAPAEPHRNPANPRRDRAMRTYDANPQHRHHRPRRPWQDHHGRPAAAPVRHLRRAREGGRHRDGQQRHRTRARHHHPGQELRRELEGHAHQHRRHPRPRGLRRRSGARAVDGRRRGAADRRPGRPDAADPLRDQEGAGPGPAPHRGGEQGRQARRATPTRWSTPPSTCSTSSAPTDEQLDFPVVYASGINGWSSLEEGAPGEQWGPDMSALFDTILKHVPPHEGDPEAPLQLQISALDYSTFVGRIGVGRINQGTIKPDDGRAGDGRPGRQADQGPRQPGADLRGPRRACRSRKPAPATSC